MKIPTCLKSTLLATGLLLVTGSVFAASSVYVSSSTSQAWSVATNWQASAVPGVGDDIVIADTTVVNSLTMNDSAHTIGTLIFGSSGTRANPTQPQFIINGNTTAAGAYALTITNGVIANGNFNVNGTAGFQTKLPIIVQGDQTWSIGGNAGTSTADYGLMLTVGANGVQRPLTLNGKLIKTGPGQLCFVGQNVGDGDIIVAQGSLKYNAGSSSLLTVGGTGTVIVSNGASLYISKNSGNLNITKAIFLNDGAGLRFGGNSSALNTNGCPITFNGNVPIVLEYASLNLYSTNSWSGTINSTITGTGGTNTFWASNPLTGTINNNATYRIRFGHPASATASVAYGLNNAGAIYDIYGPVTNLAFGALGGTAGTVRNGNTNNAPATLTVGALNTSTTFGGVLVDGTAALSLVKVGTGSLTLSGANTYSGTTTVSNGTLLVNGTLGSGAITVRSGATFGGTATTTASATLDNGTTLRLDGGVGATPLALSALTLGNAGTDATTCNIGVSLGGKATVSGTLTVNGTATINLAGAVPAVGVYDLITYGGGSIAGSGFAGFQLGFVPFGVECHLQDSGTAVQLNVTAITVESAVWTGADQAIWNVRGTLDWKGISSGNSQVYADLFPAIFNEPATNYFVNIVTNVYPAIVAVDNSANTYTFTNVGSILGTASLTKNGTGTLILANENNYVGGTYITNGVLQIGLGGTNGSITGFTTNGGSMVFNRSDTAVYAGNLFGVGSVEQRGTGNLLLSGGAYSGATLVSAGTLTVSTANGLGDTNGPTTVNSGATLNLNAQNVTDEKITASGPGVAGAGAIVNNTIGDQQNATRFVTLLADTVFGGAYRWDIRNTNSVNDPYGGTWAYFHANNHNLTKVSSNVIAFINVGETSLGDIDIQGGTLTFSRSTFMGDAAKRVTVWPGATLQLHRTSEYTGTNNIMTKVASFTNATFAIESNGITNYFGGPVTFTGSSNVVSLPSPASLVLLGPVNGTGSNTIIGGGALVISNTASYSGGTLLNASTLIVDGTFGTGSTPLQILGACTVAGNGTIKDAVTVPAGATLSPGNGGVGTLTLNNELVLAAGSISRFETSNDYVSTNSDRVAGLSKVTYGGTLIMTNIGAVAWTPGDKFKLFNATSYAGGFATISPAVPALGLVWFTNNLAVDGTIEVRLLPNPTPPFVYSVSSLVSNYLNVIFSLEVEQATAEVPGNYSFVGAGMPNIYFAQKITPTNVLLYLDAPITNTFASPFILHVQGVRNTSYVPDTVATTNVTGYAFGFQVATPVGSITNGSAFAYSTNVKAYADGADIFGTADAFEYVFKEISGDFDVSVQMPSFLFAGADSGKAGLMARELSPAGPFPYDRNVAILSFPPIDQGGRGVVLFQYREDSGGNTIAPGAPRPASVYPLNWFRLKRSGSVFWGLFSTNNLDWTLVNSVDSATNTAGAYAPEMRIGLAVTSHNVAQTTEAVFNTWGKPGERPMLSITNGFGSVGITWPSYLVGTYRLQSTSSLTPAITWSNVNGTTNVNTVLLPLEAGNLFFRLAPLNLP